MRVEFLAAATAEFDEAAAFYASEEPELGEQFSEEVHRTIRRIIEYPDAWTPISRRTRRCRTRKFPYAIIYQVRGNTLLIVGVTHMRRSPNIWKRRLPRGER